MRVLRLCSVYEAPPEAFTRSAGFDARVRLALFGTGDRQVGFVSFGQSAILSVFGPAFGAAVTT